MTVAEILLFFQNPYVIAALSVVSAALGHSGKFPILTGIFDKLFPYNPSPAPVVKPVTPSSGNPAPASHPILDAIYQIITHPNSTADQKASLVKALVPQLPNATAAPTPMAPPLAA